MSARDLLAAATPRPWRRDETLVRAESNVAAFASENDAALATAAVNEYEALLEVVDATRALLADDDMNPHWADCACSYCSLYRSLQEALARLDAVRSGA